MTRYLSSMCVLRDAEVEASRAIRRRVIAEVIGAVIVIPLAAFLFAALAVM